VRCPLGCRPVAEHEDFGGGNAGCSALRGVLSIVAMRQARTRFCGIGRLWCCSIVADAEVKISELVCCGYANSAFPVFNFIPTQPDAQGQRRSRYQNQTHSVRDTLPITASACLSCVGRKSATCNQLEDWRVFGRCILRRQRRCLQRLMERRVGRPRLRRRN
jgi:hypothetical protein